MHIALIQKATITTIHAVSAAWTNLSQRVYQAWFGAMNWCGNRARPVSPALSAVMSMLTLEGHTLARTVWATWVKYRGAPEKFGLDTFRDEDRGHSPVLLLHGAAGSWHYLGDLAMRLQRQGRSVHVLTLGAGGPTEEKRARVLEKVAQIRTAYLTRFGEEAPAVDLVAHSMGGNIALHSTFSTETTRVDAKGNLQATAPPTANPHIGKLITVALPTDAKELGWLRTAGKAGQVFNVIAQYDAIMGWKKSAVAEECPLQAETVSAGHVGIVFQEAAADSIRRYLDR